MIQDYDTDKLPATYPSRPTAAKHLLDTDLQPSYRVLQNILDYAHGNASVQCVNCDEIQIKLYLN